MKRSRQLAVAIDYETIGLLTDVRSLAGRNKAKVFLYHGGAICQLLRHCRQLEAIKSPIDTSTLLLKAYGKVAEISSILLEAYHRPERISILEPKVIRALRHFRSLSYAIQKRKGIQITRKFFPQF